MDDLPVQNINLDELYHRKRELEMNKIKSYNKILNRIHNKIKMISRQACETKLFYLVPEFDFAVPAYNVSTCISYVIQKLQENGFNVKYTHPNLLFISWGHYIPAYKRDEIKKQTGVNIDGFGNVIPKKSTDPFSNNKTQLTDNVSSSHTTNEPINKSKRDYNDIKNYKPIGIYNSDLINKIRDKTSN